MIFTQKFPLILKYVFSCLSFQPLPAVQIKDEPMDAEDDYNNAKHNDESDEMVDPTMFLERTADEGEEPIMVWK